MLCDLTEYALNPGLSFVIEANHSQGLKETNLCCF